MLHAIFPGEAIHSHSSGRLPNSTWPPVQDAVHGMLEGMHTLQSKIEAMNYDIANLLNGDGWLRAGLLPKHCTPTPSSLA